eukprot:93776-Pyramimonas_sp.AAC.1
MRYPTSSPDESSSGMPTSSHIASAPSPSGTSKPSERITSLRLASSEFSSSTTSRTSQSGTSSCTQS